MDFLAKLPAFPTFPGFSRKHYKARKVHISACYIGVVEGQRSCEITGVTGAAVARGHQQSSAVMCNHGRD
jgi:hypothetical protein